MTDGYEAAYSDDPPTPETERPMDFGWVMNEWVAHLLAVEAARQAIQAAGDDVTDRGLAELALLRAQGALHGFKDDMCNGLLLVLRWLFSDERFHDGFRDMLEAVITHRGEDRGPHVQEQQAGERGQQAGGGTPPAAGARRNAA